MFSWVLNRPDLGIPFVGGENYYQVLFGTWSGQTLISLRVTAIFVTLNVCATTLLGLGIALLMNRGFRGQWLWLPLFLTPVVMTPVVVGLMWKTLMLNPSVGLVSMALGWLGLPIPVWLGDMNLALLTVTMISVWEWTPLSALIILSGLRSLPSEPFEAAKVDGATGIKVFRHITLPLITPILLVAITIRLIDAVRTYDIIFTTTFGGPGYATCLLPFYDYLFAFGKYQMGPAAVVSLIALVVSLVSFTLFYRIAGRSILKPEVVAA
jgi:multiple sugar transport system permease protein